MSDVTREEFDYRHNELKEDINQLGDSVRHQLKELKTDTKEEFQAIWKAQDAILLKVGALVTICTSAVMMVFKMIEMSNK